MRQYKALPVKDPVLDGIVGVGGLVASGAERIDNTALPVVLHQVFEVFTVCWCWVRDIMIREPTLELSFVPFVVGY